MLVPHFLHVLRAIRKADAVMTYGCVINHHHLMAVAPVTT